MHARFLPLLTLLLAGGLFHPVHAQYVAGSTIEVTAPVGIAGTSDVGLASFGASIESVVPFSGTLVLIDDGEDLGGAGSVTDACEPLTVASAAAVDGNIALVDRGACTFSTKARNAQAAGATAVVMADNRVGGSPPSMSGTAPDVTLLVVSILQSLGDDIKANLPGVTVTIEAVIEPEAVAAECVSGMAGSFPCGGIDVRSNLGLTSLATPGQAAPSAANDIWGWTDPASGREFALVGLTDGTAFVEVTSPEAPVYLGKLPTTTSASSWRDIKTYADHAFIVSEAADHGMQVFDLSRLLSVPGAPVTFTSDALYAGITSAHNIVINEATGFAYAVGARQPVGGPAACDARGFHAIDISTPTSPAFSSCFSDVASETGPRSPGYTHDAQCVVYSGPDADHQGREICFAANEDVVSIFDVTNKASVTLLSQVSYPTSTYTHQGWLTADQRYFIVNDEIDEINVGGFTRTLVLDLVDLDGPNFSFIHSGGSPASDHNLYVHNGKAYQSNYRAGLRVLDIANIGTGSLAEVAFFDTWPESDDVGTAGQWSNYPYFPSGTIVVNDTRAGLFVLSMANLAPLQATLDGTGGYRMLASPSGDTYDELLATLWTQGFTGSDDPARGCSAYTYNETAADFAGGYICLPDQNAAFARGRGAFVYVYADDDLVAPGVQGGFPKTLAVPNPSVGAPFSAFPLTYTNNPNVPSYQEGWNLLGNPLGAGMDWDETIRGGGLTPTIYVLDPNYFGGDYRTWTAGIGGDLPNGVVPAFQGFFAKAVAASPTLMAPPESVVALGDDVYGKTASGASMRFELTLNDAAVSAVFVAVAPEASGAALGLDGLDAHRLTPTAWPRTVLSTGTVGDAEALPLALNALPQEARGEIEVPLEIAAEGHEAGALALTLAWSGALPEGWRATLVDRDANTSTVLTEGGTYSFEWDMAAGATAGRPGGLGLAMGLPDLAPEAVTSGTVASTGDRFVLRITPASVTSTESPEASGALALLAPMPNPASGAVTLAYTVPQPEDVTLVVYDALGREVAVVARGAHAAGAHTATLDVRTLTPGVYVARLASGGASSTQRFTVVR